MGMDQEGNFYYDYGTNAAVMKAAVLPDNTDRSSNREKIDPALRENRNLSRRGLQAETSQRLYNPVICIKEGGVIFFNVEAELE